MYRNLLLTIRTVRELYADLPADQFTPKKLKVVRQAFINRGNTRSHVNTCTQRVVAIFRWAAEEELVPGSLVHSLEAVRSIDHGRGGIREWKLRAPKRFSKPLKPTAHPQPVWFFPFGRD